MENKEKAPPHQDNNKAGNKEDGKQHDKEPKEEELVLLTFNFPNKHLLT